MSHVGASGCVKEGVGGYGGGFYKGPLKQLFLVKDSKHSQVEYSNQLIPGYAGNVCSPFLVLSDTAKISWKIFCHRIVIYIVGCRGITQLGGLVPVL